MSGKGVGSTRQRTFLCKHKVVERIHVLLVRLGIVLLDIFVNGTLDNFDGFLVDL